MLSDEVDGWAALMLQPLVRLGRDLGRGFLHILYPATCVSCSGPMPDYHHRFCDSCRQLLSNLNSHVCPRCAATVGPYVALDSGCIHCRKEFFHFERVVRMGPYEGLLRQTILRIKHLSGEDLALALADLWAENSAVDLAGCGAQAVVPVPLHWFKRWKRGYNQSDVLAQSLAAKLRIPCLTGFLRRTRATPQQTHHKGLDRRANVRNAFKARANSRIAKKAILLVDDVLTSGSTANEAAKALLQAGASKVFVAVLARAES